MAAYPNQFFSYQFRCRRAQIARAQSNWLRNVRAETTTGSVLVKQVHSRKWSIQHDLKSVASLRLGVKVAQ